MSVTFCWVEDPIGLLVTDVAALRFAVMLEGAALTEVVPAPARRDVSLQVTRYNHSVQEFKIIDY